MEVNVGNQRVADGLGERVLIRFFTRWIVRKDDKERGSFAGRDETVGRGECSDLLPLRFVVKQAMEKVKNRITPLLLEAVTRRQINKKSQRSG